jgi:hypothetical protein
MTNAVQNELDQELISPQFLADPYPLYQLLRPTASITVDVIEATAP